MQRTCVWLAEIILKRLRTKVCSTVKVCAQSLCCILYGAVSHEILGYSPAQYATQAVYSIPCVAQFCLGYREM